MTKRVLLILIIAVAMLITASAVMLSKKNRSNTDPNMVPVALHTFKMTDGWGYEVLVDKKIFIHQDCIPAISLYKRFRTESEALSIGNLLIDKIRKGKKPTISLAEINEAHIQY